MASPAVQNAIRRSPRAFMSMADLSHNQIIRVMKLALHLKRLGKAQNNKPSGPKNIPVKSSVHPTLKDRSIALVFNKRSTRTRVAAETATFELGGQALFLGKEDIQLGVNESPRDTATVLSSMCHGIFARVGDHSEIEELARYSRVPVVNALSSLWHPTQVLADLITIYETPALWRKPDVPLLPNSALPSLTVAYVGDSANVLHDMLVTYPRLGHRLRVASPLQYRAPKPVWDRVQELDCESGIFWTEDPKEAVKDADIVVTDTWISMGQEAEKEQRLKDFKGYQVTEQLCKEGGAAENWKFMHCLPRKQDEVDDEVFYGPRSLVFREAENRKWSMMAIFSTIFGSRDFFWEPPIYSKNKSAKPKNETESAPAESETPESQPTESK